MKNGLSSRGVWLGTVRTTIAAAIAASALAACSLNTGGTGQPPPTGTGGMGGAGGTGASGPGGAGGAGGAGGGMNEPVWTASAPDPVSGTYELPPWLRLESPSTNKTVQIGPSSLRAGFDVDAARARSVDGVTWGLTVEGERTNRAEATRFALGAWAAFNGATTGPTTGPDESDRARLVRDQNMAQQGALVIDFLGDNGATSTISAWVTTPATNAFDTSLEPNNLDMGPIVSILPDTSWSRFSLTGAENGSAAILRLRPASGDAMQTGEASIDFVSVETGRYPSSVIITDPNGGSPAPQTRMAEKLYVPVGSEVAPDGYFHAALTFAPHYATGEQASDHDLLYFDDMNRLVLRMDGTIALQEGGADVVVTSPLTWVRDQAITVEVVSTTSDRSVRVSVDGGPEETVPGNPGAAFPVGGPIHLLGSVTGSQEGADLRAIAFYPPM